MPRGGLLCSQQLLLQVMVLRPHGALLLIYFQFVVCWDVLCRKVLPWHNRAKSSHWNRKAPLQRRNWSKQEWGMVKWRKWKCLDREHPLSFIISCPVRGMNIPCCFHIPLICFSFSKRGIFSRAQRWPSWNSLRLKGPCFGFYPLGWIQKSRTRWWEWRVAGGRYSHPEHDPCCPVVHFAAR